MPVFRAAGAPPPLRIPVTRTLIVAGALASRDFQDVHHDPEAARARGTPDIFMNILTTNGLVGRYVTDWAGPGSVLRRLAIRLGAPNYPGDELTLTGTVAAVEGSTARVRIVGRNSLGRHVTGEATVELGSSARRTPPGPSESPRSAPRSRRTP
ncbi:MaoC family dehydratase [Streptomyces sp. SAJ15]|uniref:MaoC family dehydratase n=1 Tax=Streptomyces sp. SAJ15 TaxID=2011095 RepID=UPI0037D9FE3C